MIVSDLQTHFEPPPPYTAHGRPDISAPSARSSSGSSQSLASRGIPGAGSHGRGEIPTPTEVLQHLKLLASFHALRKQISNSPHLFGEHLEPGQRWRVYVVRAVYRFQVWWEKAVPHAINGWGSTPLTVHNLEERMKMLGGWFLDGSGHVGIREHMPGVPIQFGPDEMPPLDVVMVWHAYLMNPRFFLEDCFRHGKMDFWAVGLPLAMLSECIDDGSFVYRSTSMARQMFGATTDLPYDNLDLSEEKVLSCASCKTSSRISWSQYASPTFSIPCPSCPAMFTHDTLSRDRFLADLKALRRSGTLLPGTILDETGRPALENRQFHNSRCMFPNKVLLSIGAQLEDEVNAAEGKGMDQVRAFITSKIQSKKVPGYPKDAALHAIIRAGESQPLRYAMDSLLARYNRNPSPFALSLAPAVHRAGIFTTQFDTLRPSLTSFAFPRALDSYRKFFLLLRQHPQDILVPTLIIDLSWRTHLLFPPRYFTFSTHTTRRLVAHDTPTSESTLGSAWLWTAKTYRRIFKTDLARCGCWYCNATRAVTSKKTFDPTDTDDTSHPSFAADAVFNPGVVTRHTRDMHHAHLLAARKAGAVGASAVLPPALVAARVGGPLLAEVDVGSTVEGEQRCGYEPDGETWRKGRGRGAVDMAAKVVVAVGKAGAWTLWGGNKY